MKPLLEADLGDPSTEPTPPLDRVDFLNTILESSIDYSIVALDLDGVILAWNEGARRLYGYSAEEVIGKDSDQALTAPADVESGLARAIRAEAQKTGKWAGTLRRIRKDGAPFVTHATVTRRRSAAGKILGFTMISRSLTKPEILAWELENSERDKHALDEKLHETKDMFRALTDVAQQVFFVVSADHANLRYASPSYENVWGRSIDSLYRDPRSWLDAVHPDDRERIRLKFADRADDASDFQYRIVRPDGAVRWILSRSGSIKDASGCTKSLCGLAMDITELKEAQLETARSELKYRRLFESAKDGILILDAVTGAIVDINPFVLQLLGYSAAECAGRKIWDIGFFENEASSRRLFQDLQTKGFVRFEDLPLRTKDGRAAPVEFVSNLYKVGDASVIQCNIRDISERRRAEEGLRRLAGIIESSDESIVGADLQGIIQTWNRAAESLFGYRADEVVGRHISILCAPEKIDEQSEHVTAVLNRQVVAPRETVRLGKDGKPREVSVSLSLIKDGEGRPTGLSGFMRDVAQKNQLEMRLRQSQKMEGIGRLAGGIAHDFNNLLTGIMGYSEFLLERLPPHDPVRGDVAEILKSGIRAAALTRQLLAFSRQQALTTTVVDVNAGVAELDKMLRRIIGEHIVLNFIPGAPLAHVRAAAGQIEQIVINLSLNAKDSMENGGRLLIETTNVELGTQYVSTHPAAKAGRYVMLSVSDTGCGMTPEVLSHLFEPFFTTKPQGKGTGLGLSTVYGIVLQGGGSVDVYSEVGRGTTVKIYLPAVDEALAAAESPRADPASYRGNETILVVEDDETVRKLIARVLTMSGYTPLLAAAPEEAIAICGRNKDSIRLMLTDIVMPGMLGDELSRRLEPSMPNMKVIYMSGYTEQSIIQRASLRGAAFIQKPMSHETILREIRRSLDAPPRPKPK